MFSLYDKGYIRRRNSLRRLICNSSVLFQRNIFSDIGLCSMLIAVECVIHKLRFFINLYHIVISLNMATSGEISEVLKQVKLIFLNIIVYFGITYFTIQIKIRAMLNLNTDFLSFPLLILCSCFSILHSGASVMYSIEF